MADRPEMATVVFAKVPGLGIAKSRIAAQSDEATAARIYDELLAVTASALRGVPYHVAFAGAESPGLLSGVFSEAEGFFAQDSGTLGERMAAAAKRMLAEGCSGACIVGCDCPELSAEDISQAGRLLREGCDAVLGPAADGGYYLAACRREGLPMFEASGWSTPDLYRETVGILNALGLRHSSLNMHADIDTLEDYHSWRRRITAPPHSPGHSG